MKSSKKATSQFLLGWACHLSTNKANLQWRMADLIIFWFYYILALTHYKYPLTSLALNNRLQGEDKISICNPWETIDTQPVSFLILKSFWYLKKKTDKEYLAVTTNDVQPTFYGCFIMKQNKPFNIRFKLLKI